MAETHHIRVCAVGTENDIHHLLYTLLQNAGALDEPDEEKQPMTRAQLEEKVHQLAQWEGGREDGFLYETICTGAYGSADDTQSSLTVREESCGLWTACFDYTSVNGFQTEDWMKLHLRCNRLLMAAQYASHSFGLEKGGALLCGGRAMDNWSAMAECWMWLIAQYECGYPPEESVQRLHKLSATLEREDYGMTIEELLESCMELLEETAAVVEDPAVLRQGMRDAVAARDFQKLLSIQVSVAESVLWQTEHNHKWLANLAAVKEAWLQSPYA